MVEDRRFEVLRAIVEDFVQTNEPVGSKVIAERHQLGVSPATVRNDMAALEEEGYIAQPHTSAGRIPTDKGYRLFVDRLSEVRALSQAERRAIRAFLAGAVDLDDVVGRSVRLLAQLTRQVAVVQYPTLSRSSVRHVELVSLTSRRLLLVLITDTGRVEQRVVDMAESLSEDQVGDLRRALAAALNGQRLAAAPERLADLPEQQPVALRPAATALVTTAMEALVERPEERVMLAGTANLARGVAADFPQTLRPVLEALEEQVVLLKLLSHPHSPGEVLVHIGAENGVAELRATSVISAAYGPSQRPLAGLGVLGPTRMDYPATIAAVRAVARYVGEMLGSGS